MRMSAYHKAARRRCSSRVHLLSLAVLIAGSALNGRVPAQVVPPPTVPLIAEFMAVDATTFPDEDGDFSGWIEILNPTSNRFNLLNWSLTTSPTDLRQWTFPNYTLTPGASVVVFASGKNRANVIAPLHTNFRLAAAGGY